MDQTLLAIKTHFEAHDFEFTIDEENSLIHAEFTGENSFMQLTVRADETNIHIMVRPLVRTPKKQTRKVAKLVLLRNWTLPFGRFDFEEVGGRLVFEFANMIEGAVSDTLVHRLIGYSLNTTDEFVPHHSAVAFGRRRVQEIADLFAESDELSASMTEGDFQHRFLSFTDSEDDFDPFAQSSHKPYENNVKFMSDEAFSAMMNTLSENGTGMVLESESNASDEDETTPIEDSSQLGFDF